MATSTPRLGLSKPAAGDGVSAFQSTVDTSFDTLDAGLWLYRGAWSAVTAYVANDLVASSGVVYLCILGNTNHAPPDSTYWVTFGGGSGSGAIVPVNSSTMGTAKNIDLAGATTAVFEGTLDQTSCALTFINFQAGTKDSEVVVTINVSSGKTFTFAQTILWDDSGQAPVIPTVSASITFTIYSKDGGTTIRGRHGQRTRTIGIGKEGTALVAAGGLPVEVHKDARVLAVTARALTAPTGATLIFDVNKNGTTMYTTQANRPAIAISGARVTATLPDIIALAPNDYVTVDVDQIGSTIAGGNWMVEVDILEAN